MCQPSSKPRTAASSQTASCPQRPQQLLEVGGQGRLESHEFPRRGMPERKLERMQGLPRKFDRPERRGAEDVSLLADQRVSTQPRLDANLVALAGHQANLDERRLRKLLDHAVFADGVFPGAIARVCLLLNQCTLIPGEPIAPDTRCRHGAAVDNRSIDAFGLVPYELRPERRLRGRMFGKQDESRCVTIY